MTESTFSKPSTLRIVPPEVEQRYVVLMSEGNQRYKVEGDTFEEVCDALITVITTILDGLMNNRNAIQIAFEIHLADGDNPGEGGKFTAKPKSRPTRDTVAMAIGVLLPRDRELGCSEIKIELVVDEEDPPATA